MQSREALARLLESYKRYYNVNCQQPVPPFAAEASFYSHGEQYFLTRGIKLAEAESNEHIFFYCCETLCAKDVEVLAEKAWETGLSRVRPHSSHKNTDVTVIFLADHSSEEAFGAVRRVKRYKSYRHGFHGSSAMRAAVLDTSSYKMGFNGRGSYLKKFFKRFIAACQKADADQTTNEGGW